MNNIKIGIIGGAGYTAGELLRLLIHHPSVSIEAVHSKSNVGNLLSAVHTDLIGDTYLIFTDDLTFIQPITDGKAKVDLLFLCMGHGEAKKFIEENDICKSLKIIDLSQDYRWGFNLDVTQSSKVDGREWIYGLPELNKEAIKTAQYIANPGCFATAIQLAILPLAAHQMLINDIHIHAITGSTGAGQQPTDTTHFSWRNNNMSIYEPFKHRHLKEITESIHALMPDFQQDIIFLPVRGNFARGIFASVYTQTSLCEDDLKKLYEDFYLDEPFTHVVTQNPHLKQVVNTNKCLIHVSKHGNKALIISMIDNLLKGASGQAVENMNLMFGLNPTTGLRLKPLAF